MSTQFALVPEIEGARAFLQAQDNLAFMRDLPAESMKLIVTSPPYNIGKSYERRNTLENYLASQAQVISECVRLLHPEGSICWQVGNHIAPDGEVVPLDIVLYDHFKDHGLKMRNRIVWHFEHGLHASKRFSGRYETIMWFTKGKDYTFNLDPVRVPSKYPNKKHFKGPRIGELSGNPLGKNPADVWVIPNVKNNHVEKTVHPCQFPVELVERLVLSMTNVGDNVFDPYVGVGSSVVAALMHERNGYGCDVVREYVDVAWERVSALRDGTLRTRPMGKPVYDPSLPKAGIRMRVVEQYSHLNGWEHIKVHKPDAWDEILAVIGAIDADSIRTKESKEKTKIGKLLFAPKLLNERFQEEFNQRGWHESKTSYWVTTDVQLIRKTVTMPAAEQRREIVEAGMTPMISHNQTDFVKDRIAVEVQFGKYAFVAYDLFVKHMAFFVGDIIDVGVEILPMKAMSAHMSSGVSNYEGELYNVIRQGRGVPAVPLVILGVAP